MEEWGAARFDALLLPITCGSVDGTICIWGNGLCHAPRANIEARGRLVSSVSRQRGRNGKKTKKNRKKPLPVRPTEPRGNGKGDPKGGDAAPRLEEDETGRVAPLSCRSFFLFFLFSFFCIESRNAQPGFTVGERERIPLARRVTRAHFSRRLQPVKVLSPV